MPARTVKTYFFASSSPNLKVSIESTDRHQGKEVGLAYQKIHVVEDKRSGSKTRRSTGRLLAYFVSTMLYMQGMVSGENTRLPH